MRPGTDGLKAALKGSFNFQWVADVYLDGNRLIKDLPISIPSFTDDATSLVQGTGSVQVTYQGDFADSIAPKAIGDALSPFGSQLWVYVIVNVGPGFTERIPMGHYLISETPQIVSQKYLFNGAVATKGDVISLSLKDLFFGVQRDRFQVPGSPPSLASVYTEIQRLTQLPLTRTVTDGVITASVAYLEDKLQAVYDLANVLDAVAYVSSDGTVGLRPNVWPTAVDTVSSRKVDPDGTLVSIGRAMANDAVYNQVVVRTTDSNGTSVLAVAQVTDGPLRVANPDGSLSPYRRVPYFYQSDYLTNQALATAYAVQQLPRVSRLRAVVVPLVELFNPLREIGDVLNVVDLSGSFQGRVQRIDRDDTGQQTTTVVVSP